MFSTLHWHDVLIESVIKGYPNLSGTFEIPSNSKKGLVLKWKNTPRLSIFESQIAGPSSLKYY